MAFPSEEEARMKKRCATLIAVLGLFAYASFVQADDLRAVMEADNARWLAAFNTPNTAAFRTMYTRDAILLAPRNKPLTGGPDAIVAFWEGAIKRGSKDHTFEIVSTHLDGHLAYQVAQWTANLVKDTGEKTPFSGNTVRLFERQPDGRWLTKVHIYNTHQ
jgi:ketosteroid isomerase-like protein